MHRFEKPQIGAKSTNYAMSTVISNTVYGEQAEQAIRAAIEETARLEGVLSRFVPGSEISRINDSAGLRFEKVSSETVDVLSRAIEFSKRCQGCFDVTVGPLVSLWASAKDKSKPPEESEIRSILPLVNYADLVLDANRGEIGLKKAGQSIDLGGIGKGFAADKILEVFAKSEISSAFTNLGGNVAAIGTKPDGSPWYIGIQHPRRENSLIGVVSVVNKSVVTSGDYQRCFIDNTGKRYHHILDPDTGYPSDSGLVSATVVAGCSMTADALSTMVFIAGMDKGLEFLKSFPGTEAVLIDMNLLVYVTQGLKDCFQASEGVEIVILG